MRTPQFSIIIPTLNEEKFLPHLLQSLKDQTKKNLEVIIVDGSSKDKTVLVAKKFPGVKIFVSKHASLPLQRNMGAREAKGKWLLFIDADTILMPYALEQVYKFINDFHPSVFTPWCLPDSDKAQDAMFVLFWNFVLEGSLLSKRPIPPGPFSGIRADVFASVGGYDETHSFHEDMELGLRLQRKGYVMSILREALYVVSLRRLRAQGKLHVIQQYIRAALPVLFFKRPLNSMSDYVMGGQLYGKKKPIKQSLIKTYEKKLKKLMKEIFE